MHKNKSNAEELDWITLQDAATEWGLREALLKLLIKSRAIRSGALADDLFVVKEDIERIAEDLSASRFGHPRDQTITVWAAAKKYGFSYWTLRHWALSGRIQIAQRAHPMPASETDVAYAKALTKYFDLLPGRALWPESQQFTASKR